MRTQHRTRYAVALVAASAVLLAGCGGDGDDGDDSSPTSSSRFNSSPIIKKNRAIRPSLIQWCSDSEKLAAPRLRPNSVCRRCS